MSGQEPASPCIQICRMDEATGLCQGCFRTLSEIAVWSRCGAAERLEILARVEKRRAEVDPWGDALRGECER